MGESQPATTAATLAAVLQRAQRPLYGFLRGMLADEEHAHDLVQDVFCDAWRAARRGAAPFDEDGTEGGIRRWLFHAAYCRAISARRRRRLIQWESLDGRSVPEAEHPYAPRAFEDQVAESQVVRAALASLAPEEVACLLLNVVQGFTAAEIAQVIGISPAASKKRLARAKQRLRAAYFAQDAPRQET